MFFFSLLLRPSSLRSSCAVSAKIAKFSDRTQSSDLQSENRLVKYCCLWKFLKWRFVRRFRKLQRESYWNHLDFSISHLIQFLLPSLTLRISSQISFCQISGEIVLTISQPKFLSILTVSSDGFVCKVYLRFACINTSRKCYFVLESTICPISSQPECKKGKNMAEAGQRTCHFAKLCWQPFSYSFPCGIFFSHWWCNFVRLDTA